MISGEARTDERAVMESPIRVDLILNKEMLILLTQVSDAKRTRICEMNIVRSTPVSQPSILLMQLLLILTRCPALSFRKI